MNSFKIRQSEGQSPIIARLQDPNYDDAHDVSKKHLMI